MKKKILVCSFCVSMLLFSLLVLDAYSVSTLGITLKTDQPIYRLARTPPSAISMGGNLTLNGAPVSGGLVAVTVFQGKIGHYVRPILFRTLTTGAVPPQTWSLNLSVSVLGLRGIEYVPRTVFTCPSNQTDLGPAFNVTFATNSPLQRLYLTLTVFDSAKVPIITMNVTEISTPIPAGYYYSVILPPTGLKNWMTLGNATVFVSAFDNMPPFMYFPLRPEASARFTIVGQGASPSPTPFLVHGNYNLTFKINYYQAVPVYSPWGNYTIQVSSVYQGNQAVNSCTFWARLPGDINGDGVINLLDLNYISFNWQKTVPPAPACADLNGDKIINLLDLNYISLYWQNHEQPLP
jgi:hypothetical protein